MIREMRRPLIGRHAQKARNNPDWRDTTHGPPEQLTQVSKLVEPHLTRWGHSEIGDLARSIRDIIEDKS
ncbi:Uncharacterised protein [Mycobacteroides abscessus]|nr:Uncharacterised protein [Mycobacteroides abscessus]